MAIPLLLPACAFTIVLLIYLVKKLFSRPTRMDLIPSPEEDDEVGSPPPSDSEDEYDVYLSFRGANAYEYFTGPLYYALEARGVRTVYGQALDKGDNIEKSFVYINKSKICVPVFSQEYAESKWCLREVAKMVECGSLILPVFLDVEPFHVRKQTGPFKTAFARHKDATEVKQWREALRSVANIAGYVLRTHDNDRHEGMLIQIIVKRILQKLNRTVLYVAMHPVGIDRRVEDVKKCLEIGSNDVRLVGILGMGGIGKTTLAKAIFNEISPSFEVSCFLPDVRERCNQAGGLVSLQKLILTEASKDQNPQISGESHGRKRIMELLCRRSTLLVIDDADDERQLAALAGGEDWFGPKSRIIVTTRVRHCIMGSKHQIKGWEKREMYDVENLNDEESLQLFRYHAFDREKVSDEFLQLSMEVVSQCHGIPLILEVFGSVLFDKESPLEWEETLKELKGCQHRDVHQRLKMSYDTLTVEEQQIFLDIAFFFIGTDREEACSFWSACNYLPHLSVQALLVRSLIKINSSNQFEMHDLTRDMGREIVRHEAPFDPSKRSRLWASKEVLSYFLNYYPHVQESDGNDVQGIGLWSEGVDDGLITWTDLGCTNFASMLHLRLLRISLPADMSVPDIQEPLVFPPRLKWLQLDPCPMRSRPNVQLPELVVLKLNNGRFDELAPLNKRLPQLRVLDLSDCQELTATPNFVYLPYLEKLVLQRCINLRKVDESIGCLKRLVLLNVQGCRSLAEIPYSIGELRSLETLTLTGTKIKRVPKSLGQLGSDTGTGPRAMLCPKPLEGLFEKLELRSK